MKTYLQDFNKVSVEGIENYVTEDEEGKKTHINFLHKNKAV